MLNDAPAGMFVKPVKTKIQVTRESKKMKM